MNELQRERLAFFQKLTEEIDRRAQAARCGEDRVP
jgi:hypothetical protein